MDRSAGVLLDVYCFVSNKSIKLFLPNYHRVLYFLYEKKRKAREILPSCQKCILFVSYLSRRIQVYKYIRIHTIFHTVSSRNTPTSVSQLSYRDAINLSASIYICICVYIYIRIHIYVCMILFVAPQDITHPVKHKITLRCKEFF